MPAAELKPNLWNKLIYYIAIGLLFHGMIGFYIIDGIYSNKLNLSIYYEIKRFNSKESGAELKGNVLYLKNNCETLIAKEEHLIDDYFKQKSQRRVTHYWIAAAGFILLIVSRRNVLKNRLFGNHEDET